MSFLELTPLLVFMAGFAAGVLVAICCEATGKK